MIKIKSTSEGVIVKLGKETITLEDVKEIQGLIGRLEKAKNQLIECRQRIFEENYCPLWDYEN